MAAAVVVEVSRLHVPTMDRKTKAPITIKTTLAQPDVRTCFAPHFGHASAVVLISVPHSLHLVIATAAPLLLR